MTNPSIQSSTRTRMMRRGVMVCGSLVASVIIYVVSIGPLAFLEAREIGNRSTWQFLHEGIYHPIFLAWERSPKWVSSSLRWYTKFFEPQSSRLHYLHRCFGAGFNDMRRHSYFFDLALQRKGCESPGPEVSSLGFSCGYQEIQQINREIEDLL